MSYSTTSGSQLVTAFFDSRSDAESAVDRIVEAGVPRGTIQIVAGADTASREDLTPAHEKGFWESLGDLFMPDEDRMSYAEGLRRGGYVVSLRTTPANRDLVIDILDDEGTVNMDEREESWRAEGWSGTDMRTGGADRLSAKDYEASGTLAAGDRDGTIEVVEEDLRIGKRDVSHGRVRVRSYVVEDDVSEDVTLRSERVDIERVPVDRPVGSSTAAFRDQTLELEETSEEAVVSKEARVKEEINLNRTVEDRTETVSDTVRRTEVEIEDERGLGGRRTGTTLDRDSDL